MTRRIGKLSLDVVLLLVLALMYQKQVLTLAFHEIGGLCLFALFALHTLLNHKWIAAIGARLFDRTLSTRLRLCYWVDVFLVASFICVAVSGVLISKTIFSFGGSMVWKALHYSSAAVALLLTGVHLGLHWRLIFGWLQSHLHLRAGRQIVIATMVLAVAAGSYGMATSSIPRWLAMPFTMSQSAPQAGGGQGEHARPDGEPTRSNRPAGEMAPGGMARGSGVRGGRGQENISAANVAGVAAQYSSIALGVSALVYALDLLAERKKRKIIALQLPKQALISR